MQPPEAQFSSSREEGYSDAQTLEPGEREFSASLEDSSPPPRFVVDSPDEASRRPEIHQDKPAQATLAAPAAPILKNPAATDLLSATTQDWRDQVSAKVRSYHSRRRPKARYPSLRLPLAGHRFLSSSPARTLVRARPSPPIEAVEPEARASQGETRLEPEPHPRVLEFPPAPAPVRDELAEAVERPRIVEVPELAPPPPAMGGILIQAEVEREPERRPGIDLPLKTASLTCRLAAGAIDFLLVLGALTGFGSIFLWLNGALPEWRARSELALTLIIILWPTYQYLFLVFSGSTPGLRLAGLEVTGFDGLPVKRRMRMWRALAALLSWLFLGLGYLWCFFDEDQLSWHDRVTHTHLAPRC